MGLKRYSKMKNGMAFFICIMPLLSGCGQDDGICSAEKSMRHLKYDFGYELASEVAAPQLKILFVKEEKNTDNMVWCSAKAELRGHASDLVRSLQLRAGTKRWRHMESYLANQNLDEIKKDVLKKTSGSVALFLLSAHRNEMSNGKEYVLPVQIDYMLEKRNGRLENIEYSSDLNVSALKMMRGEMNLSVREAELANRITY